VSGEAEQRAPHGDQAWTDSPCQRYPLPDRMTIDALGLVAKVATGCRAEPDDLYAAKRIAWRSADARICR
jgi:hypothetical protein